MSNDKTTLADVQPGGRVRLGDAPWPEIDAILADAYSAGAVGLPFEGIARRHAVRAAVAALSAQPSPGGQGDGSDLLTGLRGVEEYLYYADSDPIHAATVRAAINALAARQPVGQQPPKPAGHAECPVTGLPFYDNMEHPERGLIAMYGGPLDVYSVPVLQDNDGELRRERYDLDADCWVEGGEPLGYFYREQQPDAARQPVGEPAMYQVRPRSFPAGEGWREVSKRQFDDRGDFPGYPEAEWERRALYAAPPAQAVDLDAMRALLQRRIEQWRSHLPADPGAPGTREIETKGEHDYNNDVRIYREGIAVMEQVLSKIDSQAVGNG
ncbi:hypothetical protein [Stenotrophomonas geniculata]|uniref:hypothetical protein n=1 Tax=Stenotrophomonas geniculata TaxID=86188 RepID=UPI00383B4274